MSTQHCVGSTDSMIAPLQPSPHSTEPSDDAIALVTSARYGDLDDVTAALQDGVSPDAVDDRGCTGLHMASANGHIQVVQLLLDESADVTAGNAEGNTPLHWACLNGHQEVIRALLAADASPSALNMHDCTPIDEVLNLGESKRQQILEMIDNHMKSLADDGLESSNGDTNMDTKDGEANDNEASEFTFVQKPPPSSCPPSV